MERQEAEKILKKRFGIDSFYQEQWDTIRKIIRGERVLLIGKTGFGKSLCFQFPALLFDGITVIFSPLIALMRDQVKKLNDLGIAAYCINSEQSKEENTAIINMAKNGSVKLLYIAPERQDDVMWIDATRHLRLAMVVVDEAHCISAWGHDFRPAFRRIIDLVRLLPGKLPVLATTATATRKVEQDIATQIGGNISVIRGNLIRANLRLYVIKVTSEDEKLAWLGSNLTRIPGSGIIYTGTRSNTELYSRWLNFLNISSSGYNAGLDTESRLIIESGLMANRWKCVVSTNALGMGIDKPDIRFIIHTQIPQSPVHYYQEIGRAGRDGKPAWIILFYNPADCDLPIAFIEGSRPSVFKYQRVIEAIKQKQISERDLLRTTNLRMTQLRIIKADLIEQKIIRDINFGGRKKSEYIPGAPPLNTSAFELLRAAKLDDLRCMVGYTETNVSRMKYLCDYLGDTDNCHFNNCDNTGLKKQTVAMDDEICLKIAQFHGEYFPELVVGTTRTKLINGVASSFYGISDTGATIHRCKYEGHDDFPDFLVRQTLMAFYCKLAHLHFDLILHVPATKSGNLVKEFAIKISQAIRIPVSHDLKKSRMTSEQKAFENSYLKADNVKDAFLYSGVVDLSGISVLLIDDIFDSGATIKEIGRYLTTFGVEMVAPLVIAKTVGGDKL